MEINKYVGATASDALCLGVFDYTTTIVVIILSCVLGIAWAIVNYVLVKRIDVSDETHTAHGTLINDITPEQRKLLIELGDKISNVITDLFREPSSS
jgi:hypothetical protein